VLVLGGCALWPGVVDARTWPPRASGSAAGLELWDVLPRGYDHRVIADRTETAFYYPGVIWRNAGWVKSLALFFDEVALLVPDYMRDRPLALDPAIAEPLQDAGLLRVLSPETLVGRDASEELATAMVAILASGALDDLPREGRFEELSWSRMGGVGDPDLARMVFEELERRGLAKPSEDGASVPMHRMVRSLYLVLLAQILRNAGPGIGLELSPATDRPEVQEALVELLSLPAPEARRRDRRDGRPRGRRPGSRLRTPRRGSRLSSRARAGVQGVCPPPPRDRSRWTRFGRSAPACMRWPATPMTSRWWRRPVRWWAAVDAARGAIGARAARSALRRARPDGRSRRAARPRSRRSSAARSRASQRCRATRA